MENKDFDAFKKEVEEFINQNKERKNEVEVGDIKLSSTTNSLKDLSNQTISLLNNKTISTYLNISRPKRQFAGVG